VTFLSRLILAVLLAVGLTLAIAAHAEPRLQWLSRVELARDPDEPSEARHRRLLDIERAIVSAARGDRELAAMLVVLGAGETHFAERFGRDGCRPGECDRGRAKGYFQAHRGGCGELWERPRDVVVMAECAARTLRWARARCKSVEGAFALYGTGSRCSGGKSRQRAARVRKLLGQGVGS
jgi:hypothetical protein